MIDLNPQLITLLTAAIGLCTMVVGFATAIYLAIQNGRKVDAAHSDQKEIKILVNGNLSTANAKLEAALVENGALRLRNEQLETQHRADQGGTLD